MTALPAAAPDVDALIRENRARTPRAAIEARKSPRSSIAELNDMDPDELRDRYIAAGGYDDRTPVTRVLDLIDLPRNVTANLLFRGSGAVESEGLRKGAFGMPVVTTSDALKNLGVSNKVARGILGFVGDVALDPLTYLGPAGWGLEVMDNAGRAIRVGKSGAKGLRGGIKDVAKGGVPRHQPTKELFDTLLANAPDTVKAGDAAAKAAYLSKQTIGDIGPGSAAASPFYYLSRGLGGDARSRGGNLGDLLAREGAESDAARKFVGEFGAAAGPGIGKGGSQVAHIPFTDISAKVPGFTRAGRAAEQDLALARSAAPRAASEIATPAIVRASQLAREIDDISQAGGDASGQMQELSSLVNGTREAQAISPQNPREVFQMQKYLDEADAGMAATRARMTSKHNQVLTGAEDADDIVDNLDDAAGDELATSVQDAFKAYQKYRGAVTGSVRNFAQNTPQEEMLTKMAMRLLDTDDRVIGRAAFSGPEAALRLVGSPEIPTAANERAYRLKTTVFGERGTSLAEAGRSLKHDDGPGARRAVDTYLAQAGGALRRAFADAGLSPTGDDLDEASALLMALATKKQAERGAAQIGSDVDDGVYYTRAFGSEDKAPFLQHIEKAIASGKLSPKLGNGLMEKLEGIAETYGADLLKELQDIELREGIISAPRAGYIPNETTPAAAAAIAGANLYQKKPMSSSIGKSARDSLQKPRSFDQFRWTSPVDGREKRLFRADIDQAERFLREPEALEALRDEGYPAIADKLQELVSDYTEFLDLPDPPRWRNTDPFEMNELAKEGRFSMMLNGRSPVGGFMQTNMLAAMASRVGKHQRAMARAEWQAYVDKFGLKIPKFEGTMVGNKVIAADGSVGKIVSSYDSAGRRVDAAELGGQRYRPVSGVSSHNPMMDFLGLDSSQDVYHEQAASAIERMAKTFEDPNPVIKGINTLTQQWKNLTLLHPSWTVFNMIGDTLNAVSNGANPAKLFDPSLAKFSAKVTRHAGNPEKLRQVTHTVRGIPITGEQLMRDLVSHHVIDGTMMEENALKMVENKVFTMPSSKGGVGKLRPAILKSDFKDMAQRFALARGRDGANRSDKFRAAGAVASDRYMNNFIGPWFKANQKATNYFRTQLYLSYLEDGYDSAAAARKVIESQFDYADSTRVEQTMFKTLFPFYSWMRNNGAYQIKKLLESPVYAASFPKLQTAIEEAIAGDERVPLELRPSWMRNALALQVGTDPEKRSAVLFGGALPAADVYQHLTPILGAEGIQDFLKYFASGLNPLINLPLQIAAGQETFSGRTIGADATQGDVTIGELLRNQIRPLAEGPKLAEAYGRSIGEGVARTFLGGRAQNFSDERITSMRLREQKDAERKIRAAINRAERKGESSIAARVKLMQLYDSMNPEDIPVWARKQLAMMEAK